MEKTGSVIYAGLDYLESGPWPRGVIGGPWKWQVPVAFAEKEGDMALGMILHSGDDKTLVDFGSQATEISNPSLNSWAVELLLQQVGNSPCR